MTVEIQVGKTHYKIDCEEHEKEKLQNLTDRLNQRMDDLAKSLKIPDEKMLLVMAALTLTEEVESLSDDNKFTTDEVFDSVSDNLENVTDYIEKLIKKIKKL